MPYVEWNDKFSVGIQQFDEHHRHLIGLLNSTYDNFTAGASEHFLETLLDELVDYATYHFTAEEIWMKNNDYPDLAGHKNEHEYFSRRVLEILRDFSIGKEHLSLEVLAFLKSWLLNHILTSDASFGRFAAKKPHSKSGNTNGATIRLC